MLDYNWSEGPSQHIQRRKELMKKYPEQIKMLGRPNPWTALFIILLVCAQFSLAYFFKELSWSSIVLGTYFIGAFISHALYVLIHEATHNTIFKTRNANKLIGMVCDFPLVLPSALAFRKYHMYHHRNLGDYILDPDVTAMNEAKLIGTNPLLKSLWIAFFFLSQALRPTKLKHVKMMNSWILTNVLIVLAINVAAIWFIGIKFFAFLFLSTFFGLGLHPLGGRWIQEHYTTKKGQETYSYYGPLNLVCFNMGYHNEHHDIMHIPWNNLPKLKKLAPEFYEPLKSYNSWTMVLVNFIFSKNMSPFTRIVYKAKAKEVNV